MSETNGHHYSALLERVYEVNDLRKAARVLSWDRETAMPQGGAADRTLQIATLHRVSHALYTSDETGALIEAAAGEINGAGYLSTQASLIRFLRRDYDQARRLPAEFVSKMATINGNAIAVWKEAKAKADFTLFAPCLEVLVDLASETAELLGYAEEPYDALLGRYELGVSTAQVDALFQAAKDALVPLYRAIGRRRMRVQDDLLRQHFPVDRQEQFSRYIAGAVGYDFNRGALATAVHPFSTSLSVNDVRITTRYNAFYLASSLFATLHEAGHAIYVQNVLPELNRTLLAKETSAGLDESQSRLVENMIGRSRGFWRAHYPALQRLFPEQLGDAPLESFYRAVNRVHPGFIRVEADELTYHMHVILRFEIERMLLNGELSVAEVPAAWNARMKAYLGIVPPSDDLGCLQDIHWAMVGFGYFPTYSLGSLYAAQFYEAAVSRVPGLHDELAQGEIDSLLGWLRENVHCFGRMLTPEEIALRATGRPLDHHAFVRYVSAKFGEIYDL
jgi:carboxypeptidase Taq